MKQNKQCCPYCKSGNAKFLYRLDYGGIYKCFDCKVAYATFYDGSIEQSNKAFKENDFIKVRIYDQYQLRKVAQNRLRLLREFVKSGSILEFGSCTGEFLYECAKSGYKCSSVDAHSTILNLNKTDKLKEIISADANFFKSKLAYDVIAAFHVVEHLKYPGEFFINCNLSLKDNGMLFLEVPNFNWLLKRLLGKRSGIFYDYHICYFDKKSLKNIIERCGYEIILMRTVDEPENYIDLIYNPLRHRVWSLIKKIGKKANFGRNNNISCSLSTKNSLTDEIRMLNSAKAKTYRLERNFIRAISKVLLPISMIFEKYYLGCNLQVIARKINNER